MLLAEVTPTSQAVTFALVGGCFALFTLLLTNHSKRETERAAHEQHERDAANHAAEIERESQRQIAKEQRDYDRLDEVARRAELANERTLTKLEDVELLGKETYGLGKVTHALVNSDKTAEMRDRRDAKLAMLMLMRELVGLKEAAGKTLSPEAAATIEALVVSIKTLEENIEGRLAQQHLAEAQVEAARTGNVQSAAAMAIGEMEGRISSLEAPPV